MFSTNIYIRFCPRSASDIKPLDAIQELVSEAEDETWDDGYVHADSEYDSEVSSEISMVVRTGVDATSDARIDTQNNPGIPSRDQIKVSAKGMANSGEEELDEESVRRLDNGMSRELESELNSVRKEQSDRETDEADEAAEIISKGSPDKLMGRGRGRKWHQALTVRNGEFLRSSTKKVISKSKKEGDNKIRVMNTKNKTPAIISRRLSTRANYEEAVKKAMDNTGFKPVYKCEEWDGAKDDNKCGTEIKDKESLHKHFNDEHNFTKRELERWKCRLCSMGSKPKEWPQISSEGELNKNMIIRHLLSHLSEVKCPVENCGHVTKCGRSETLHRHGKSSHTFAGENPVSLLTKLNKMVKKKKKRKVNDENYDVFGESRKVEGKTLKRKRR